MRAIAIVTLCLALADVMLTETAGKEGSSTAADYWSTYRAGAALALKTYCVE